MLYPRSKGFYAPPPALLGGENWVVILPRTTFGTGTSYEMNNISGFRQLKFYFQDIYDESAGVTVRFQVGVAGPTFRTSGYVGFGAASVTAALSEVATAAGGNVVSSWLISVYNPGDSGEKTTAKTIAYLDTGIRVSVGRYDTAEANTCFRIIETGGLTFGANGFVTIIGKP